MAQRVLTRDGEIISLTPKATEILVRLVVNAGQLLEKDDLLKEVWPDTFVEEANLTQNIFTLRRALGDERAGPRYIETVSRRGYRFVADVRVCENDDGRIMPVPEAPAETPPDASESEEVVAPPPVVVVFPFFNETGDEGLEYLAEGLTDNIINNLARVSRLRVMSRSAVFRRNVRSRDPQNIGKELGATVVLIGKITSRPATLGGVEPAADTDSPTSVPPPGAADVTTPESRRSYPGTSSSDKRVDAGVGGTLASGPDLVGSGPETNVETGSGSSEILASKAGRKQSRHRSAKAGIVGSVQSGTQGNVASESEGEVVSGAESSVESRGGRSGKFVARGGEKSSKAGRRLASGSGGKLGTGGGGKSSTGRRKLGSGRVRNVIVISVELVEVATGWQLWGESFDCDSKDLLQIQDAITRQLLVNLKLKLTGEEEKRVTARYTENAEAYQAYLEGRYHWSRYTRKGIETAIKHFRRAIELDSNYALSYAAIVDCYLRLATNYLPPEQALLSSKPRLESTDGATLEDPSGLTDTDSKIKLRYEWDWKGIERELLRANELRTDYPAAHQWYAAYRYVQQIFKSSNPNTNKARSIDVDVASATVPYQIACLQLTPNERVQIYCVIARDQIDAGNYDAASDILQTRWSFGEWPKLDGLTQQTCADLLFTAGELAGCIASTRQSPRGQKHGEALLNGSIAIFEQLCSKRLLAEARIELALCYYRQGSFDSGRSILVEVLKTLTTDDIDLRSLALIRLASLERHARRLQDALSYLKDAEILGNSAGPWASGRCHLELASTYKDLVISEEIITYSEYAKEHYRRALHEFEAVGNHRLCAIVENNLGVLLLIVGDFMQAEVNLLKARRTFDLFDDRIRRAQVDESLAQLYLAQHKVREAQFAIERSVETMEFGDEDVLLAESLITKGSVYCELKRYNEAQKALDAAYRLAWRCGDSEGAGRAVLILVEKLNAMLSPEERSRIKTILLELLSSSQQASIKSRAAKCLQMMN